MNIHDNPYIWKELLKINQTEIKYTIENFNNNIIPLELEMEINLFIFNLTDWFLYYFENINLDEIFYIIDPFYIYKKYNQNDLLSLNLYISQKNKYFWNKYNVNNYNINLYNWLDYTLINYNKNFIENNYIFILNDINNFVPIYNIISKYNINIHNNLKNKYIPNIYLFNIHELYNIEITLNDITNFII